MCTAMTDEQLRAAINEETQRPAPSRIRMGLG